MLKPIITFVLSSLLICQSTLSIARQPYHTTISTGLASATVSAPNLVDLTRELKAASLAEILPSYNPTQALALDINLRGIHALSFFAANSTTLVVQIPQAGTTEAFAGATRNESLTLFKDFIRDGGNHHRLLKAYARYSPIDPIAGNPNSLLSQMAQADYLIGRLSPLSGCECSWQAQPIVHQFQTGMYAGRAFSGGFDTTSITLPLRYSYSPDLNWAFIFDLPITYNRNGGASSVFSSLGLAVRIPLTSAWSLTPNFRCGAGGTLDLCTSGDFVSAGLTSAFNVKIQEFVLCMTNFAGYYSSANLWLTGINFNYHLHNYIFKNGLTLTSCKGFCVLGKPLHFSLSFVDSAFAREHLYISHYDEIGLSVIATGINPLIDYDCLSLGISYQFGQHNYHAYCLNAVYQF